MRNIEVLVLSLDEVYNGILNWQADMIVNDRQNVLDHLRHGRLDRITWDVRRETPAQVVEHFAELNLGEAHVVNHYTRTGRKVNQVLVEMDIEHYVVVWDVGNVDPDRKVFVTDDDIPF